MEKYYNLLKNNKLFQNATKQNIIDLLNSDSVELKEYNSGQQINLKGNLVFIISGTAAVYSSDSKRKLLLRTVQKNELFGLAGLFSCQNLISKSFAKTKTQALLFSSTAVKELLEKDAAVMQSYLTFLSERIAYLNNKITFLTAGSAKRKLAMYLLSFESDEVNIKISYSDLADMLDIGRASLYRALDDFVEDGEIERRGNSIIIKNKEALLQRY